ncbi:hypothetical protein UlMin_044595 [Ulmus minor]
MENWQPEVHWNHTQIAVNHSWIGLEGISLNLRTCSDHMPLILDTSPMKFRWIKEWDYNSAMFHRMVSYWRNKNVINRIIREDELVLTDQREIVNEIVSFYENLYKETSTGWWDFEEINWGSISVERAEWLERPFEEEEIKKAVFGCDREKSPGPDGFTGGFFQDCWDFLKDDIVKVLEEFYLNGKFCGNMNHTFLCLIPKKQDAQKVKDFRPISLVSGLYKILAKLLSNRLREVLEETISLAQGAFVHNRQILDVVLVATEAVEDYRKRGERGVIFKVDFEKAYDYVNWDFLDLVLEKKGFGVRWRSWMRGCIYSANFSIMINGKPRGRFGASRGLRQGDPLSPFLFILVADILGRMMDKAVGIGEVKGFKVGREEHVFRPQNKHEQELTLIQSVLSSIPTYYMSLFKLPRVVAASLEKMMREFLWDRDSTGKGRSLVRWKNVCKPKELGGLGIGNLILRNKALLGKWLWRFPLEQHSLWSISLNLATNDVRCWAKSVNHLFLHCCSARFLWLKALGEVGIHWAAPASVRGMFLDRTLGYGSNNMAKTLWNCMVFSLLWHIWLERNIRIFEDKEMSLEDIFEKAKFSALQWAFLDKSFKGFPFSLVAFNWKDVIGIS